MVRIPNPNPRPAPGSWPYDLNNPESNRAMQNAQADRVRAQQAARDADWADEQAHRDRIQQSRQADADFAQRKSLFLQRAGNFAVKNKIPIERAWEVLDPDNEFGMPKPRYNTPAPRVSAVQKMLSKLRGGSGGALRALGPLGFIPDLMEGGNILRGNNNPRMMD